MKLSELLQQAIVQGATDVHLEAGKQPYFRLGHDLQIGSDMTMTENVFDEIQLACEWGELKAEEISSRSDNKIIQLTDNDISDKQLTIEQMIEQTHSLHRNGLTLNKVADTRGVYQPKSKDSAFTFQNVRVRVHLYKAQQSMCGTLRILYNQSLAMPTGEAGKLLHHIVKLQEGLVLVSGPTGSGKSFTLASCLECINKEAHKHIITLEDPIEFTFQNKGSLIHQRQLGQDMDSMAAGVRDALREDPDVIMIGELRDRETLEAALHAAETGHLVFATLHTQRAVMAINRMISVFPAEQQEEVRAQLSQVLRAVLCQRLVRIETKFIVVRDILLNTPAVANLIRQRKEPQIVSIQETQPPMQTMEMAVAMLEKEWGPRAELKEVLEQSYEML
ncbi:type IV pilus twitching motility protein PilT [Veillonella criceti]|uniref:Twitching mobility protein n=1 Tax=Veillonella criceti TaxID=103891 RepID=A0A380NJK0_9FIRM|nr:ATPase, T2SS/T4P/T4SS family [Veillonella criceti]SUP41897.1 Twitching mobility protein [Veillonella criceti]